LRLQKERQQITSAGGHGDEMIIEVEDHITRLDKDVRGMKVKVKVERDDGSYEL